MLKTIEMTVYTFDELSDKAKEKARDWWREASMHDEWWEHIYDDAERAGLRIEYFDIGRGREIGLRFVERREETMRRILKDHGEECETYKAAMEYLAAVTRTRMSKGEWAIDMLTDERAEFRDALKDAYLGMLDREYEYVNSDEYIDEAISANEYMFTESGRLFG